MQPLRKTNLTPFWSGRRLSNTSRGSQDSQGSRGSRGSRYWDSTGPVGAGSVWVVIPRRSQTEQSLGSYRSHFGTKVVGNCNTSFWFFLHFQCPNSGHFSIWLQLPYWGTGAESPRRGEQSESKFDLQWKSMECIHFCIHFGPIWKPLGHVFRSWWSVDASWRFVRPHRWWRVARLRHRRCHVGFEFSMIGNV